LWLWSGTVGGLVAFPGTAWRKVNLSGSRGMVVTKGLRGYRWLERLTVVDCRFEIEQDDYFIGEAEIRATLTGECDVAFGQLTESWSAEMLGALRAAGASLYSQQRRGLGQR
jgi:hypothetical protein